MKFLNVAVFALIALGILSILYRLLPHRSLADSKPKFTLFPKYAFPIAQKDVSENLNKIGFTRHKESNLYIRGHALGDFVAKFTRLTVIIKGDTAYLQAPIMAILFDTGDLWKIAREAQG